MSLREAVETVGQPKNGADLLYSGEFTASPVDKETFVKLLKLSTKEVVMLTQVLPTKRWSVNECQTSISIVKHLVV